MTKAEKKTLKLSVEKPQYITVNDITYAQVDSWFGHCRRDLKLDIIYPETKDGKIYPCILWICGGAWLMMDKSLSEQTGIQWLCSGKCGVSYF